MSNGLTIILGLGETGLSCVKFLTQLNVSIHVMDTRNNPPYLKTLTTDYATVPCTLGKLDEALLLQAEQIIISPGLDSQHSAIQAAIQKNIPVISDIELFGRYAKAPIIAVTGTNGKSTVVTLLAEMIKQEGKQVALGGNIGTPALDLLITKPDIYILELSSYQLEHIYKLPLYAATILNIEEDHMERYKDFSSYRHAKQRIFSNCKIAVCARQDANTWVPERYHVNSIFYYGDTTAIHADEFAIDELYSDPWIRLGNEPIIKIKNLALKGRHNTANILAALTIGNAMQLNLQSMIDTLSTFTGLPHRCEHIATINDVVWINDSKATNVAAAAAAIKSYIYKKTGNIILIAGGRAKDDKMHGFKQAIVDRVDYVIAYGEARDLIAHVINEAVPLLKAETLQMAVGLAYDIAKPGDLVLLSPACSSYDCFTTFAERGNKFKEYVRTLNEVEKV